MDEAGNTSHRRMGQILVERGFITDDQLGVALSLQETTGRLLGEICVEKWGLDRIALADALGEQWEEIDHGPAPSTDREGARDRVAAIELEDVRSQLAESEAARAGLVSRTDDLERRLALLEALVTELAPHSQNLAR